MNETSTVPKMAEFVTSKISLDSLKHLAGVLLNITKGVGMILLAYALGKLVLAFRDENPESKLQAISLVFVAVLLITAQSYLNTIFGVAAGAIA